MNRKFVFHTLCALFLVSCFSSGQAQSEVITIPPQTRVLENGWEVSYVINAGKLNAKINLPCTTFKRQPNGLISAPRINQCTLHPFSAPDFEGTVNDFVAIWEQNTCNNELDCCKPTCVRRLAQALGVVPRLKVTGCDNGIISMVYEGMLDDIYASCGAPPENGFASISIVQSMPTSAVRIPVHGRWFYTVSPSATNDMFKIGLDRLVISSAGNGKAPLPIDRTGVFASDDLPIRIFKNPDTKLAIYMNVVLTTMDGDFRSYTGNTRLYSGSNFVEAKTTVQVIRFLGQDDEPRWKLLSIEMKLNDITLMNVQNPNFAPGPDGFGAGLQGVGSEFSGGEEFYTILSTPGAVKMAHQEIGATVLAINSRIFPQAPKRRELVEEKTPEVQITAVDRVRITQDSSAPQLRRASVILVSHIKSSKPYKVDLLPGGDGPSFVYFEQQDASCDEEGCDQQWLAVTAFVPEADAAALVTTYNVRFNILACSPLDQDAVAEGRCIATPYVNLKTSVIMTGSFEMIHNDMIFKNHLLLNAVTLPNAASVSAGQRIDGLACVTDEVIGEIDASIQVAFPRVSIVAECAEGMTSFSLFEDGKPMDDELAKKLDGKIHPFPMNRGCMQYDFNAVAIKGCPRMGLAFEYEIRSPMVRNTKRDVYVTLQSTNSSDAILTVVEGDNTGSVTVNLNTTNNYTVGANFLWDDDDSTSAETPDATDSTSIFRLFSPTDSGTGSSESAGHHHSGHHHSSESTVIRVFKYDSHHKLKSVHTISEGELDEGWGVWIFIAVIVFLLIIAAFACLFCPGYGVYNPWSSAVVVDEDEELLRDFSKRGNRNRVGDIDLDDDGHVDVVAGDHNTYYGDVNQYQPKQLKQRKALPEQAVWNFSDNQWKRVGGDTEPSAPAVPANAAPNGNSMMSAVDSAFNGQPATSAPIPMRFT